MKLAFSEIVVAQLAIDEDIVKEYLEYCKEEKEFPRRDNFIEWIESNFYTGDLIEEDKSTYSLTESQFKEYIQNIKND